MCQDIDIFVLCLPPLFMFSFFFKISKGPSIILVVYQNGTLLCRPTKAKGVLGIGSQDRIQYDYDVRGEIF